MPMNEFITVYRRSLRFLSICSMGCVATMSLVSAGGQTPQVTPRIVSCDEVIQSQKRGVCEKHLDANDFQALSPGVSWYYNWHYKPDQVADSSLKMTFVPMAWGDKADAIAGLDNYLSSVSSNPPPFVLAINEPNLKGQAFINPEKTADLYERVKQITDNYHLTLVGPNMALGSGGGESIKAIDPIENKEITYTFMIPFMKAFLNYAKLPSLDGAGIHTYGNIGEMQWAVGLLHKECNCPIWVTEFACWNSANADEEKTYMMQATDFLERTDYVKGYAWFMDRLDGNNGKLSLLEKESGKLTPLGDAYVNMPVHDPSIYYKIPGNLAAGKYASMDKADISISSDGKLLINSKIAGSTVKYNIYVDYPGQYSLEFAYSGSGKVALSEAGMPLGSVNGNGSGIASATIQLGRGCHSIVAQFDSGSILLSSINFKQRS